MNIELFQQDPGLFFVLLFISLIITVLAYGAFPLIFAKTRKKTITYKKYKWLCYGVNFIILFGFMVLNGGVSNGAPFLLWTWIFLRRGEKILGLRGIMQDSDYYKKPLNPLVRCKSCGYEGRFGQKCPRCQNIGLVEKVLEEKTTNNTETIYNNDKIQFCRKCGKKLLENSQFCQECGTEIIKE